MSAAPLLAVEDLAIDFTAYGVTGRVLDGVSLSVAAGEHVALVGESGCGKSVTLRAIMDILRRPPARIRAGRILFDGRDLLAMPAAERDRLKGRDLSMIFQDPTTALNPVFTIGTQLGDVIKWADRRAGTDRPAAARRARVIDMLGQVRMPDPARIADAYPTMLSGGMRQRVLIAMALLNDPRLLAADEPGTALDVTTQDEILALMADLVAARGLALLMVTHNLGVVRTMADRVYVMYAGTVVEQGPAARIFAGPRHPYTRALIACVPTLSGSTALTGIDGSLPDYADPPPGCRFAPRCPERRPACAVKPAMTALGDGHAVACWAETPA